MKDARQTRHEAHGIIANATTPESPENYAMRV
jgi:hypothetical protein